MKTKLSSINLLTELSKPENRAFLAEFTDINYTKNTLIYSPGHERDLVFIVKKGRLRLYLAVEDKDFSLAILDIRPDMPVIICTVFTEMLNAQTAKNLGARDFLMKPLTVQLIASAIRKVLENEK